jgi:hypothetical protein
MTYEEFQTTVEAWASKQPGQIVVDGANEGFFTRLVHAASDRLQESVFPCPLSRARKAFTDLPYARIACLCCCTDIWTVGKAR